MPKSDRPFGRPVGSSKYGGPSKSKSFRLTLPCAKWIEQKGGRAYLESLVPKKFIKEFYHNSEHEIE